MTKVIIVCRNEDPNDPNPMKPITINTIPGKPRNLQSFLFPFFAELTSLFGRRNLLWDGHKKEFFEF